MATNTAAPACPGAVVGPDLNCLNCGRPCAEYTDHRDPERRRKWEHRRGSKPGAMFEARGTINAQAIRMRALEDELTDARETIASLETRLDAAGEAALARIEAKLDDLLSRPAGLIEWHPDHRRVKDGGRPVREQRREVGLPKRPRRPAA